MNPAIKRILSAFLLLIIFALALYLRFYGIDWAFKDNIWTHHPDEMHYQSCASLMNPQGLTEEEKQLPFKEQLKRLYEKNLNTDAIQHVNRHNRQPNSPFMQNKPGLVPSNYNYGTFPLHLYMLYQHYLQSHSGPDHDWVLLAFPDYLSLIVVVFVLAIGLRLFVNVSQDLRLSRYKFIPWHKDDERLSLFFPSLILPITGLILFIFMPYWLIDFAQYDPHRTSILLPGRLVTAWFGALTVLMAYLIGYEAYNRTAGLIAAFMLAVAMLHVQTSHFATVDGILGFWATASVYCFLKVSKKPRFIWYVLGAICTGFAVSTKWSGITLPGILWIAHAIATWGDERQGKLGRWIHTVWLLIAFGLLLHFFKAARASGSTVDKTLAAFRDFYLTHYWWMLILIGMAIILSIAFLIARQVFYGRDRGWWRATWQIYLPWLWLVIAIPIGVFAFLVGEPMAYFDSAEFGRNMAEQSGINMTGDRPVPYTQQFRNTYPIFYSLDNLFYPSLDYITAFFVIAGCGYAFFRIFVRKCSSDLLLASWVIPSFLMYSSFSSKFPRYLVVILPVMMVLGGRLLSDLIRMRPTIYIPELPWLSIAQRKNLQRLGWAGCTLALLCGLIYGCSYVGIYDKPHTLVTAGNWLQQHINEAGRPNARIVQQSWDESLNTIHVHGNIFIHDKGLEESNPVGRIDQLVGTLHEYDYIVLQSKRGYGSTLRNPDHFPITNKFLKGLFAEQLGFEMVKVVTNPPQFMGWKFRVDEEDETARIYDHPKIVIFEKVKKFDREQLKSLVLNPPDWVNDITAKEIYSARDGDPVYAPHVDHPIISWWLVVFVLGWIGFILLFPLCSALPDRGYAIGKTAGIALFSWLCWFIASVRILPFSRLQAFCMLLLLIIAAIAIFQKYKHTIIQFLKEKWTIIAGFEILFLVLWGLFLCIRLYSPAAYDGEKPMNLAFMNATYRADTFPPEDPWISDYWVNYYYYGQAVFSIVGKLVDLPAAYVFNLAGTTVSALIGLSIFALAYALSRKKFLSFLALYLALFSGHIISFINLVRNALFGHDGTTIWFSKIGEAGFWDWLKGIGIVIKWMWFSLMAYVGLATEGMMQTLQNLNWDLVFWQSRTDIFLGSVASEFPYWTQLYMDLHAHLLVAPFSLAFLVVLYAYFAEPRRDSSFFNISGKVLWLGLLLGTVICTNTWDMPGLMLGLLFIVGVKFWRESELLNNRLARPRWMSAETLQSLLRFPIGHFATVLIAAVFLYLPFHFNFVSRVNDINLMTEGNTPVKVYLGFWAHILYPIVVSVILLAVARRNGGISLIRTFLFAIFYMLCVALALYATRTNPFDFPAPHPFQGAYQGKILPMDYRIVGLFLPFLMVLFLLLWNKKNDSRRTYAYLLGVLGLGLSLGIEIFYINEKTWAEPTHRWNTAFKFNIQVWRYLAIFAALSIGYAWDSLKTIGAKVNNAFIVTARTLFLIPFILLLLISLPFTIIAPAVVTLSHGARGHSVKGNPPTLNAIEWIKAEDYDDYCAILWLNRFVDGTPNIVEAHGSSYFGSSRFSTNTGLPAMLGWEHHAGERIHFNNTKHLRVQALKTVFQSPNKETVLRVLGRHSSEYLTFGTLERQKAGSSLKRFEEWGDIFKLTFRHGQTSIFHIQRDLNSAYDISSSAKQPALPPAMQPESTGISMFEGGLGFGNGQFNEPRGIEQNVNGDFLVVDTLNHRIQCFKPDGSYKWQLGEEGDSQNEFKEPNDIAIDPQNGDFYISDTWNQRIVRFDKNGTFIGDAKLGFYGPRGIAFHPMWRVLYIADTGNHQIKVMTLDGQLNQTWGDVGGGNSDNAFREPVGIDVMPNGNVIVLDSRNKRLKIHSPKGDLIEMWPIQTEWDGSVGFEGHVTCKPDGTVYMTDPAEGSVHIYTPKGELSGKITADYSGQKLMRPIGITYTNDGRILVTDQHHRRVVRIR